eukprot:50823-Eustigmatos_ZCMA.PRE.1
MGIHVHHVVITYVSRVIFIGLLLRRVAAGMFSLLKHCEALLAFAATYLPSWAHVYCRFVPWTSTALCTTGKTVETDSCSVSTWTR